MDTPQLKERCIQLVTDTALFPEYDESGELQKTYCNVGAQRMALAFECHEFSPAMDADLMAVTILTNASKRWTITTGQNAVSHAFFGGLAFAFAMSSILKELHGHIATIVPQDMAESPSLGKALPFLANVGAGDPSKGLQAGPAPGIRVKPNWICLTSEAFPIKRMGEEPAYAVWQ